MGVIVGVDVGGTKVSASIVDPEGRIGEVFTVKTGSSVTGLLDNVVEVVASASEGFKVEAVGVGVAGFMNKGRTSVLMSPNMLWLNNVNFKVLLEERLSVGVVVENDANAAVWGEFKAGAGVGFNNVCMLTVGTGVGGGIVSEGRLVVGAGSAGEVGHFSVVRNGLECGCGRRGCLELYASGGALKKYVEERMGGQVSPSGVKRLINLGSPAGVDAVHKLGGWLGVGCSVLDAVVNPEVFIIGGGVSDIGGLLLDAVAEGFYREGGPVGDAPMFKLAQLGNDAGIVGAGLLAHEIS